MPNYELVEIDSRQQWTTVSKGGDFIVEVRYIDGKWHCGGVPTGADGGDEEGEKRLAPVSMGFPLAGVPRHSLIGRYIDNDGFASEPFYVGRFAEVGPFPNVNPDYFVIQLGPNDNNLLDNRGKLRVRISRRDLERRDL